MRFSNRPWLTAALLGAAAGLVPGCGKGLFDRASVLADSAAVDDGDGGTAPPPADGPSTTDDGPRPLDDGPRTAYDARPVDDGPRPVDDGPRPPPDDVGKPTDEITQVFDSNGGRITLGPATLTIGPGSFKDGSSVPITIRRYESVGHVGAYGPVFVISVPAPHLFRELARLTLQVPDLGPNQSFLPNAALGTLDPTRTVADQQWVPTYDSALSSDQKTVSGSLTDFENLTVVEFAVVIGCPSSIGCPKGQACNSSACQQCPTLTSCH